MTSGTTSPLLSSSPLLPHPCHFPTRRPVDALPGYLGVPAVILILLPLLGFPGTRVLPRQTSHSQTSYPMYLSGRVNGGSCFASLPQVLSRADHVYDSQMYRIVPPCLAPYPYSTGSPPILLPQSARTYPSAHCARLATIRRSVSISRLFFLPEHPHGSAGRQLAEGVPSSSLESPLP